MMRRVPDPRTLTRRKCQRCGFISASIPANKRHSTEIGISTGKTDCDRVLARNAENERIRAEREAELAARKPYHFAVTVNAKDRDTAHRVLREMVGGGDVLPQGRHSRSKLI